MARVLLVLALAWLSAGHCPPRDPQAQEDEGRLCGSPCAPDGTCRQANKVCTCDGSCGGVCLDPALRCPPPPAPLHGRVNVSLDPNIHSEAHYECDQGFLVVGPNPRRCRGDTTWTTPVPTCQQDPFQCLGEDLHSSRPAWALLPRYLKSFYLNGDVVSFICSRTARLSAGRQGTLKCVQGRWQKKRGECIPRPCPAVKEPADGWVEVHDKIEARFGCNEGFHLVGLPKAKCLAGEWLFPRGKPHCHPDEFEDDVDDSVVEVEAPSPDSLDTEFPLLQLSTAPSIVHWEPLSVVLDPVPLLSKRGHCIVPHATNVVISQPEHSTASNQHLVENGTLLLFSCPDSLNYFFIGSRQRVCQDGRWTGEAVSCSPISPGQLRSPPGLAVRLEHQESMDDFETDDDGSILVPLGAYLHVDCFWPQNPESRDPEWAHPSPREQDAFQQAWDSRGERFTLSVWNIQEEDSGSYTCTPPTGTPHSISIQVLRPDEQIWSSSAFPIFEETSIYDATPCRFQRKPNVVAWSRGRWLNVKDEVPDQSTVHLRCKDPGRYVFQGSALVTCVQGHWMPDIEGTVCQTLVRDSEFSPPPIDWHTSQPAALQLDGSILVPPGTTLTLDCLWVLAEPGHGWYYPVWLREGQQPDHLVQLPAEIVALPGPPQSGIPLHYGYRVRVSLLPPERIGQPLYFTCLTPSETRHTIRIYVTAFCLLSSTILPFDAQPLPSALQPVFQAGQSLSFLSSCGSPSHIPCRPDGTWGSPPPCPHPVSLH